jgi:hypothetical protein
VEKQRVVSRAETLRLLANGFVVAIAIAASAVPIWALQGVIEPLAGKTTQVNANVVISISVAVSIMINVAQAALARSRQSELRRLRARVSQLEPQLASEVMQ